LLSESWAYHKKQRAVVWNARMAEAENQICPASHSG
jgi:hypothetical protein